MNPLPGRSDLPPGVTLREVNERYAEPEMDDSDFEGPQCGMCGDDGWIMLSDAGPSEWGEDCFCEIDRAIECPECRERRRHEAAMKKLDTPTRPPDRRANPQPGPAGTESPETAPDPLQS